MVGAPTDDPLILTAELPKDIHRWATNLRTEHFPPERNYLEAHVTLFHALPAQLEDEVCGYLRQLVGQISPVAARLEGIMSLGGGTALKLSSEDMLALRDHIADRFHGMLTVQDQHQPRLHVTIQNKVTSKEAKALQQVLELTIESRNFHFPGLALFRYRGGPWDFVRRFAFRGEGQAW